MRAVILFGVLGVAGAQVFATEEGPEVEAAEDDPGREAAEPTEEEEATNEDETGVAFVSDGTGEDLSGEWWNHHGGCKQKKCGRGEGDCNRNSECSGGDVCRMGGCKKHYHKKGGHWQDWADCCGPVGPFDWDYCKLKHSGPCDYGEGDCDCHAECGPGLKCGVNNCRKMHPGIPKWGLHWKADCCTVCSEVRVKTSGSYKKLEAEFFDAQKQVVGLKRTLVKPPALYEPAAVWNLPSLEDGDKIKLKCCKRKGSKCQFFVTVYHCKPCSEDLNGGIPATLLGSGWTSGSCAPRFELPMDSGNSHAMTAFHMTLHAGEKVEIPINKDAPHVAVYERTGHIDMPWCPPPSGPQPPGPGCTCIPTSD